MRYQRTISPVSASSARSSDFSLPFSSQSLVAVMVTLPSPRSPGRKLRISLSSVTESLYPTSASGFHEFPD